MILIKIGGGNTINFDYILDDLKNLKEEVIIVHGANSAMKTLSGKLQVREKFITSPSGISSRYSDKSTMEIFTMAYCGLVNKQIVSLAIGKGINAIGLSGIDAKIFLAKRKESILSKEENGKVKVIRDNYHGKIIDVNDKLLQILLQNNYVPILTAPAVTEKGEIVNIDNDIAISELIKKMKIKKVISFIDQPGLLENFEDKNSLIATLPMEALSSQIETVSWRMKKKLIGALLSFENGLDELYLADGTIKNPIQNALQRKCTYIYRKKITYG